MGLGPQDHVWVAERLSTLGVAVPRLTPQIVVTANGIEVVVIANNRSEAGVTEKVAGAQRTTSP